MNNKQPLLGLNLEQLKEVAAQCGLPGFAAGQMARWLYQKRATSIDQMTDISIAGRQRLGEKYYLGRKEPLAAAKSKDGTVKYLFQGVGGHDVEAVYIPDHDRATLCVSSQAGCKMACAFCMTGRQGWHGQLSTAQVINQILSIPDSESLTNIVFMGMGEPADNLDAVMGAIEILTAKWGLGWSPKRITVSSVGLIPGLKKLLDRSSVHIAISLHLPDPAKRAEMMPAERAWPLSKVLDLLRDYDFSHQRRLSFEYIVWRGINDTPRAAMALARMLKGLDCRVNLIRFHAIPDSPLQPVSQAEMEAFRDRLNDLGITATVRASRGEDIMAACGMLAGRKQKGEC